MAYTKQTWHDLPSKDTPINASRLGHIEDGIYAAASVADAATTALGGKVDKVAGYGLSENDFTDMLKSKLDNIESGAQVNVQADWDEADSSSDAYIANKPTITDEITEDSTDLIESGAVYDGLASQTQLLTDTVGWTGKNQCVFDLDKIKSINTSGTWNGNVYTRHTATFTFNADGSIKVNGTPSSNAIVYLFRYADYNNEFKNMLLSGCPNGGTDSTYYLGFRPYPHNASEETVCIGSDAIIKNISASTADVVIKVSQGVTVSDITFKPMIRLATITDDTYEPYHASVEESKTDNTVIAPVENGTTASQAYTAGSYFQRNGKLGKAINDGISNGGQFNLGTNYIETTVAAELKALADAIAAI